MDFLKRNMFFILCGVGAIVGVGLGVTGLQAMPKVVAKMKEAESLYSSLQGVESKPVNEEAIEAERQRIAAAEADRDKVLEKAMTLYPGYFKDCTGAGEERRCKLETLVGDVLPEGSVESRLRFRAAYHEAMNELLTQLKGGTPSNTIEQDLMRRKIDNEKVEMAGNPELAAEFSGEAKNAAGVLTRAGVRQDPRVRADLQAARKIDLYVTGFLASRDRKPDYQPSLEFDYAMEDLNSGDAPYPEDVWRAQLGYWVQRDLVSAIVDVNNAAGEELKAAGVERWVGTMPVKELISIRLSPDLYVPPEGQLYPPPEPGGFSPAVPTGTAETVFTGSASGPYFEVVQVSLKLVMDQRDVLKLVERVTNDSFYTLVRMAYHEVAPNLASVGKIYGAEPTVNVVLDFELVMLGGLFRDWIPPGTCERYAIPCPAREEN